MLNKGTILYLISLASVALAFIAAGYADGH